MLIFWAVLGGFLLDALFGDPAWLPHPVVSWAGASRRWKAPAHRTAQNAAGRAGRRGRGGRGAAAGHAGRYRACLLGRGRLHPALGLALQMLWCGQARWLPRVLHRRAAMCTRNWQKATCSRPAGPWPASWAVTQPEPPWETVAENASDGVIAPLLYMLLGGAPLALTYKAINTMDSMLGYKNEKYLYFRALCRQIGRCRQLAAQPPGRAALGGCGGADGNSPAGRGASGGGTAAATPAPTAPRPRAPAPGHWACSWRARPITLENITISRQLATRCGRSSRGTSCVPTA